MRSSYLQILLPFLLLTTGCVSYEELINFREVDIPLGASESIENAPKVEIQPNDLLRIQVLSINPEAAEPFNQQSAGGGNLGQLSNQNIQLFQGYLVDQDGFIDLPILGRIEVEGQTIESLQLDIRGRLKTYLKDPVVNIRFLNFKVTMLGEFNRPGIINLPNSRITLLEAIGLAGDMTQYANRKRVLIVREKDGVRDYHRLNLQRDDVFNSPYYYLEQNDLVYVEPIRARTATVADPGQRIVSYGTAALSVATLIIALTRN